MPPFADLRQCTDCRCLAARRAAREITRRYDESLRPHGLRITQFSVLAMLALRGPSLVGELADALGLERTTLTRSASLLRRRGWVVGKTPGNRREHPLALATAGRRMLLAAFPAWQAAQHRMESTRPARG